MNFFLRFSTIKFLLMTAWLGVGVTLGCNSTTVAACGQAITSLTEADRTNLNLVCQKTQETINCFRDLVDKCEESFNASIQAQLAEMSKAEASCRGFGANSSCSQKSILGCVEELSKMPDEDKRDLSKSCMHIEKSVSCLNKEIDSCPDVIKNQLQSQKDKLNQAVAICTPFLNTTGNSSCDPNSIMACAQPLTNMTESERKNISIACQKMEVTAKCLTDAMNTCPDFMQGMLQTQRIQMQASLAVCGTQQNNTNSSTGGSPTCSQDNIMLCMKPLSEMTQPDQYDLSKSCPKMEKAVKCITDGIDTCPVSMQSSLQAQRDQLKTTLTPCKSLQGSGNSGCSTLGVVACMTPVQLVMANTSVTLDVKCRATSSAFNCLLHKKNNCPSALKASIEAGENLMEQIRLDCDGYGNGTTPGPQFSILMALVVVLSMLRHFL